MAAQRDEVSRGQGGAEEGPEELYPAERADTLLSYAHEVEGDLKLIRHAAEQGFDIPAEIKALAVRRTGQILRAGDGVSQRTRLAAVKCLAALDARDLQRAQLRLKAVEVVLGALDLASVLRQREAGHGDPGRRSHWRAMLAGGGNAQEARSGSDVYG